MRSSSSDSGTGTPCRQTEPARSSVPQAAWNDNARDPREMFTRIAVGRSPVVGAPLLLAPAGHTQAALPHRRRRADGGGRRSARGWRRPPARLVPRGAAEVVEAELAGPRPPPGPRRSRPEADPGRGSTPASRASAARAIVGPSSTVVGRVDDRVMVWKSANRTFSVTVRPARPCGAAARPRRRPCARPHGSASRARGGRGRRSPRGPPT